MALRRQGLAQRRKAVGLTQESLAQRLGVERSTVVRWEAGDTEPLPSIRPHVARALELSLDQLAELLTESENADGNADTTRAVPPDTDVTIPVRLPEVQSEVWLDRAEFDNLIRPQGAETVLRRALRSAGVVPEDADAMLLVGKSSPVPLVATELGRPVTVDADLQAAITLGAVPSRLPAAVADPGADVEPGTPVPTTWMRSRFKRFAAVGALALAFAGGAASVPHNDPIPQPAAGIPEPESPVVAIPAPEPGSSNDNNPHSKDATEAGPTAPAAAPNKPGDGAVAPAVAAPRTIRTTSRSKLPASATAPAAPLTPVIPAEVYAWSQANAFGASDQRGSRLRPGPPSRP